MSQEYFKVYLMKCHALSTCISSLSYLSYAHQREVFTAILDFFAGLSSIPEGFARQKCTVLHDSVSLARMMETKITYSSGSELTEIWGDWNEERPILNDGIWSALNLD